MRKKKIIIQTNSPLNKTGLGQNGKYLLKYLLENCADKYEIVYYCTQASAADPSLQALPCKAYGCIPNDQNYLNQIGGDQLAVRNLYYGCYYIDEIIKNEKPDIWLESDDLWSTPAEHYLNKPWFKKVNAVLHKTIDSRPVLEVAFEQAKSTKNYLTWASFAEKEMKRFGQDFQHIKTITGIFDTSIFEPISKQEKLEWRKKFNIDPDTLIFMYLSRNQLRKSMPAIIEAFAQFRKEFPKVKAKLHFHTSFSEKGQGWDIPKLMAYHGLKQDDILATYICKHCGQWEVRPYTGEDTTCRFCGTEKSQITANIALGVPDEEMKYLYGISDASINAFTSGGLEMGVASAMLCGLPTACTNYSCGEDYCEGGEVYPLDWKSYYETGSCFTKAATTIESIRAFMNKVYRTDEKKRREIGNRGREWAVGHFSMEVIGKKWENLFDSLPYIDWADFKWDGAKKNPDFALPSNYKEMAEDHFLTVLYKEILNMDEPLNGGGRLNWKEQLKRGATRESVYEYFKNVAREENNKNKPQDLWTFIDRDRSNKRAIFVLKESIGDCVIATSLFESFHERYPNHDLYVSTEPKFFDVFEGNPHIHKLLPYSPIFEQEMAMIGAGQDKSNQYFDVFFHPAIQSQRLLNYLSAK